MAGFEQKKKAFWNWLALLTKLSLSASLNAWEYHPNPTSQLLVMFLFSTYCSTLYIFVCLLLSCRLLTQWESLVSAESDDITIGFLFALTTVQNSTVNLISHIIYYKTRLLTQISPSLISWCSPHPQAIPVTPLSVKVGTCWSLWYWYDFVH